MGYDGNIKINTEITTKKATSQLLTLENRMSKLADKIAKLKARQEELGNSKLPTAEYTEINNQITKAERKFADLLYKQSQMVEQGKQGTVAWDNLNAKMEEVGNEIRYAKGELEDLIESGKDFKLGTSTDEFTKVTQQLENAQNEMNALSVRHDELSAKQTDTADKYKIIGNQAKKAFSSIGTVLNKANGLVNSFMNKIKNIASKAMPSFTRSVNAGKTALNSFGNRVRSIIASLSIFSLLRSSLTSVFQSVSAGLSGYIEYNTALHQSVENLKTSLSTLGKTIGASFAPIITIAVPYLQTLIGYLQKSANVVSQFIASLCGKSSYTAVKSGGTVGGANSDIKDTSEALDDVTDSATEAKKALEGYLSPIDEINKFNENNDADSKSPGIKIPKVDKPKAEEIAKDIFYEVPIESWITDLADKFKNVIAEIFAPLKKAWDNVGQKVIDAWKFALNEIWELIKAIGSDFLEVWNEAETVEIFENLLLILADIGEIVGHLAQNFREAWEENENGKHILENIRDIIGVIVEHLHNATSATVEWAKNIDFSPILQKINEWTASLVPVIDSLAGIIEDFYTTVLLPLGKWVLEDGLPDLLQVFIDFNNDVDWDGLRKSLKSVWEHLEPFAERVGEGLILFIDRCSDALSKFINSETFDKFLDHLNEWLDSVSAEDVANTLQAVSVGILAIKGAVATFQTLKTATSILKSVQDIVSVFGGAGASGIGAGLMTIAGGLLAVAEAGAGAYVAYQLAEDAREWYENIQKYGWDEGRKVTANNNPANPYNNGNAWTQNDGTGILDKWNAKFKEWQQNNATVRAEEKENFSLWYDGLTQDCTTKLENYKLAWSTAWENVKTTASTKWDEIKTNASTFIDDVKLNIETKLQEIHDEWSEKWENIKSTLSEKWENIKSNVSESVENIKTTIQTKVDEIKASWDEKWDALKKKVSDTWDETKKKVSESVTNVKTTMANKLAEIKTNWDTKWDSFKDKVSKTWDDIKKVVQDAIDWVGELVDKAMEKINKLKEGARSVKSSFSIGGSYSYSGSSFSGGSLTGAVGKITSVVNSLSTIRIPKFATGGVIPTGIGQHLAVVGDNKYETEVVSPLSTMKQAMLEALEGANFGGGETTVKLYLDGRQIAESVVKAGKAMQMSTGLNMFSF